MQQYASTCLQNHCVWSQLEFWRDALYTAIQAELVRIYTDAELSNMSNGRMISNTVDGVCECGAGIRVSTLSMVCVSVGPGLEYQHCRWCV